MRKRSDSDEEETQQEGVRVLKSIARVVWVPVALLAPVALLSPLAAQDSIPGVTLGLLYEAEFQPALAVQPFSVLLPRYQTMPAVHQRWVGPTRSTGLCHPELKAHRKNYST